MDFKKYNRIILYTFVIIISIVSITNYIIDPYDVFNNHNFMNKVKSCVHKNHRFSKIPAFKFFKKDVYAIWIGSSKTWEGANEEYESKLLGKQVKNLAISSCTVDEAIIMAKNALIIHPEIKTIYWGLDFFRFEKSIEPETEQLRKIKTSKIEKDEILPVILSLYTFKDSLKTIAMTKKRGKEIQPKYGQEQKYNKKVIPRFKQSINKYHKEYYKNYVLDDKKFEQVKDFIKYAEKKGVKVIFFATSMHITERIDIYNTQNQQTLYTFKEKLAEIQPYYDFSRIDKYTKENIEPTMKYWRDSAHPSNRLRMKLTNQLFLNNEDFGVYITKNNVKEMNLKDNLNFENYIKQNPQIIEKVKEWSK